MTVWIIREGKLVEKRDFAEARADNRSIFPRPMVSRLEPYESPIDGHEVTSWGERDREMKANDAYDPRDFSGTYTKSADRKNPNVRSEPDQPELPFWTDPD